MNEKELLIELLKYFYVSSHGIEWGYIPGVCIRDIEGGMRGKEIEKACIPYLNREDAEELIKQF